MSTEEELVRVMHEKALRGDYDRPEALAELKRRAKEGDRRADAQLQMLELNRLRALDYKDGR